MARILWIVLVVIVVLWLIGLLTQFGGNLIHLLLVVAAIVLVINLVTGRRAL
ncbi:lmo0937 family membrane protein [Tessaracoccus rhinocerotis]|uniref:Lmo0937 family membrane protein n=1 Tax=Tessaracoccus rhinocerotis TaxID=1689449 RepID=A0A553K2I2_9ACTN|nr:lmo0937 family membrane protein [Tessaracoccus rhinocerotis]TRY18909.1 lmo0937 family membrane protein [Tessaracoccus rhinocerotis]